MAIPDGTYTIKSEFSERLLQIRDADLDDGGRVVTYEDTDCDCQLWRVIHEADGYYRVINLPSGKAWSMEDASMDNDARTIQLPWSGEDYQLWDLHPQEPGWFTILNKNSRKALTVSEGNLGNDAEIRQYEHVPVNSVQNFQFTLMEAPKNDIPTAVGGVVADCSVDECANPKRNATCALGGQICTDPDWYKFGDWGCSCIPPLTGFGSGRLADECAFDECEADCASCENDVCSSAGQVCYDPVTAPETVSDWMCVCPMNQTQTDDMTIAEGTYYIESKFSAKLLDVREPNLIDGGFVVVNGSDESDSSQVWRVIHEADGYYRFMNLNSGKALSVRDARTAIMAPLIQSTWLGEDHQLFKITEVEPGWHMIINKKSDLAMDVWGWDAGDDALIRQHILIPENSVQNWRFTLTPPTKSGIPTAVGGAVPDCKVDECADPMRHATCALAGQACIDPDFDKFGDWGCSCLHPLVGFGSGRVAEECAFDECEAECATCEDDLCSNAGQLCYDPVTTLENVGDWMCTCRRHWQTDAMAIPDGTYTIKSEFSERLLQIRDADLDDGGCVVTYEDTDSDCQLWRVIHEADGYYRVINLPSGKAWSIEDANMTNDARTIQLPWSGEDYQLWDLHPQEPGWFTILNKNSRKALTVSEGNSGNDAEIRQYQHVPEYSVQNFQFTLMEAPKNDIPTAVGGIVADCSVDECANPKRNATCALGGQICTDPDLYKFGDWGCSCIPPLTGFGSGRLADECAFDECEADCASCENDVCSSAGQVCYDPVTAPETVSDWMCVCPMNQTQTDDMTIAEGTYYIESKFSAKLLDVREPNLIDDAFVVVNGSDESDSSQVWRVIHEADGYYRFMNLNSGKALSVRDARTAIMAPLIQSTWLGEDHQLFKITEVEPGWHMIINKKSDLAMDVWGWDAGDDALIRQHILIPENSVQNWRFTLTPPTKSGIPTAVGGAVIGCSVDECADPMHNATCTLAGQLCVDPNLYNMGDWGCSCVRPLVGFARGRVADDCALDECEADCATCENNACASAGQLCLDPVATPESVSDWMCMCQRNETQADGMEIADGTYRIESKLSSKLLRIRDADMDDGGRLVVHDDTDCDCQLWRVVHERYGWYRLINLHSRKALSIHDASPVNGAAATQLTYVGGDHQLFRINEQEPGWFTVLNKKSEKYLEVRGSNMSNNAEISQYHYRPSELLQFWRFTLAEASKNDIPTAVGGAVPDCKVDECADPMRHATCALAGQACIDPDFDKFGDWGCSCLHPLVGFGSGRVAEECAFDECEAECATCEDDLCSNAGQLCYDPVTTLENVGDWMCTCRRHWQTDAMAIPDGTYTIKSEFSERLLQIRDADLDDGGCVVTYEDTDSDCQLWRVIHEADGYYRVINLPSGKAWSIEDANMTNDARTIQLPWSGEDYQLWDLHPQEPGWFTILNKNSRKALTVSEGNSGNDAEIRQYQHVPVNSVQNFQFTLMEAPKNDIPTAVGGIVADCSVDECANPKRNATCALGGQICIDPDLYKFGDWGCSCIPPLTGFGSGRLADECAFDECEADCASCENDVCSSAGQVCYDPVTAPETVSDWMCVCPMNQTQTDDMTIAEGTYYIESKFSAKLLDVREPNLIDDAFVVVNGSDESDSSQVWRVIHEADGYYRFMNLNSGKALSVRDARTDSMAPLIQSTWLGEDHQLFKITEVEPGWHMIINKKSDLGMYVWGWDAGDDALIRQHILIPENSVQNWSQKAIQVWGGNSGNDAEINQFTHYPTSSVQNWKFTLAEMSKNDLRAAVGGPVADCSFDECADPVRDATCALAGQSCIDPNRYKFGDWGCSCIHEPTAGDFANGRTAACALDECEANCASCENDVCSSAGQLCFDPVTTPENVSDWMCMCEMNRTQTDDDMTIADGTYRIESKLSSKLLRIRDADMDDGGRLVVYEDTDCDCQLWRVVHERYGWYRLINLHSRKALSIHDALTNNGAAVSQLTYVGGDHQLFRINEREPGWFTVLNKKSEKCLELWSSNMANDAEINQYHYRPSESVQLWSFTLAEALKNDIPTAVGGAVDDCKVDECADPMRNATCALAGQICIDPDFDKFGDWGCSCLHPLVGFGNGRVAEECAFDECEADCATCEDDLCSNASQLCYDPVTTLENVSDWMCTCQRHWQTDEMEIADGTYKIKSEFSGRLLQIRDAGLDDGGRVVTYEDTDSDGQLWRVIHEADGYYRVINLPSGKAWSMEGASMNNDARNIQLPWSGEDYQLWDLHPQEPGWFTILNKNSQKALTVSEGNLGNDAEIRQYQHVPEYSVQNYQFTLMEAPKNDIPTAVGGIVADCSVDECANPMRNATCALGGQICTDPDWYKFGDWGCSCIPPHPGFGSGRLADDCALDECEANCASCENDVCSSAGQLCFDPVTTPENVSDWMCMCEMNRTQTDDDMTIADGTYRIESKLSSKLLRIRDADMDDGGRLVVYEDTDCDCQLWRVVHERYGWYRLINLHSRKALSIHDALTNNGAAVSQLTYVGGDHQLFRINEREPGWFTVLNKKSEKCLELWSSNMANDAEINQYHYRPSESVQLWSFTLAEALKNDIPTAVGGAVDDCKVDECADPMRNATCALAGQICIDPDFDKFGDWGCSCLHPLVGFGNGRVAEECAFDECEADCATCEDDLCSNASQLCYDPVTTLENVSDWMCTCQRHWQTDEMEIADGTYKIKSEFSGRLLQIRDAGLDDGGRVVTYEDTDSDGQLWRVIHEADGYYRVINLPSGKAWSMEGASMNNDARNIQLPWSGEDYQLWDLHPQEPGWFTILNKNSQKALTVSEGNLGNDAEIRQYQHVPEYSVQNYQFTLMEAPKNDIPTAVGGIVADCSVDECANPMRNATCALGGQICTDPDWYKFGDWGCSCIPPHPGFGSGRLADDCALDECEANCASCENDVCSSAGQLCFDPVTTPENVSDWMCMCEMNRTQTDDDMTIADGTYRIESKLSSKLLRIRDADMDDGGRLVVYEDTDCDCQLWRVVHERYGWYRLINLHSRKALSIHDALTNNGAAVSQLTYVGGDHQLFRINEREPGWFTVLNKKSEKCLELWSSNMANDAEINQYHYRPSESVQLWSFTLAEALKNDIPTAVGGAVDDCKVDECADPMRNATCALAGQICIDPDFDKFGDWGCSCLHPLVGFGNGRVAEECAFDECEADCATCEDDLCSNASQLCYDPVTTLENVSDWMCTCQRHWQTDEMEIADGTYKIKSEFSGRLLQIRDAGLDDGGRVVTYEDTDSDGQLWRVIHEADGYYRVINLPSGKAWSMEGASMNNDARNIQLPWSGEDYQLWDLHPQEPGWFTILNKNSQKALTVSEGNLGNDAEIRQYQHVPEYSVQNYQFTLMEAPKNDIPTAVGGIVADCSVDECANPMRNATCALGGQICTDPDWYKFGDWGCSCIPPHPGFGSGRLADDCALDECEANCASCENDVCSSAGQLCFDPVTTPENVSDWMCMCEMNRTQTDDDMTIADGTYRIESKLSSKLLRIRDADMDDGGRLVVYEDTDCDCQLWRVVHERYGWYRLINLHSRKALSIHDALTNNGAAVSQLTYVGGDHQLFRINEREPGWFTVLNKKSEKCLELWSSNMANDAEINQYHYRPSESVQLWSFTLAEALKNDIPTAVGGAVDDCKVDECADPMRNATCALAGQICIDPDFDKFGDWGCSCLHPLVGFGNGRVAEECAFDECEADCATCEDDLCSNASQLCYDPVTTLENVSDWMCTCQRHWQTDEMEIADGTYKIKSEFSGRLLQIRDAGLDDGGRVVTYEDTDSDGQLWRVIHEADGYYRVINLPSGKAWSMEGASMNNDARNIQLPWSGEDYQLWDLHPQEPGWFTILNKNSQKALTVSEGNLGNDAEIRQYQHVPEYSVQNYQFTLMEAPKNDIPTAVGGIVADCSVDECANPMRNATCALGGQICTDPDWYKFGDWGCSCIPPHPGFGSGRLADDCALDECEANCASCENDVCSSAGQLCFDPVTTPENVSDWMCMCEMNRTQTDDDMTIADGTYRIESKLSSKLLRIRDADMDDGGRLVVYEDTDCDCQLWRVVHERYGWYRLINLHSRKALSIHDALTNNGAAVSQLTYVGGDHQLFRINEREPGWFTVLNKKSEKCLELWSSNMANDAEINQYHYRPSESVQLWSFTLAEALKNDIPTAVGGAVDDCKVDECADPMRNATCALAGQICIDPDFDKFGDWGCSCLHPLVGFGNGRVAEECAFDECEADCATCEDDLCSNASQLCYDPVTTLENVSDWMCTCQRHWQTDEMEIADGTYKIKSEFSGRLLQIRDAGLDDGGRVVTYEDTDSDGQLWRVIHEADGYYRVINLPSGKAWSMEGASMNNDARNIQLPWSGEDYQLWDLHPQEPGWFTILNKNSQKALTVSEGNLGNDAEIRQYQHVPEYSVQNYQFTLMEAPKNDIPTAVGGIVADCSVDECANPMRNATTADNGADSSTTYGSTAYSSSNTSTSNITTDIATYVSTAYSSTYSSTTDVSSAYNASYISTTHIGTTYDSAYISTTNGSASNVRASYIDTTRISITYTGSDNQRPSIFTTYVSTAFIGTVFVRTTSYVSCADSSTNANIGNSSTVANKSECNFSDTGGVTNTPDGATCCIAGLSAYRNAGGRYTGTTNTSTSIHINTGFCR
ncbi:hypothetical protein DIPPA_07103 [Diplonema papillatum]|nr:hypothetical protein DIPPA_07103 [Diplonema papillatum]